MELESFVSALKDQKEQVEPARGLAELGGALAADAELVVKKRAVLKKILLTPIWVRPVIAEDGQPTWEFAGVSRYDRVLERHAERRCLPRRAPARH